jgi:hypothetical protein
MLLRSATAVLNACADVQRNAQKLMMASHSIALIMLRLVKRSTRRPARWFPPVAATPHNKNMPVRMRPSPCVTRYPRSLRNP